jgi:hypothetical protein
MGKAAPGDGLSILSGHYPAGRAVLGSRLEAAAQRALESGACRFKSVESILQNSLDQQPLLSEPPSPPPAPPHDNIRGAEYFE